MNEKVKLPKNVIDTFRPALDSSDYKVSGSLTLIRLISDMYNRTLKGITSDVANWLNDYENQWKLIDALRYGYEAEPEPRWGIKAGNCYMKDPENWGFDNIASQKAVYWTVKSAADETIKMLGFGEVVDLNKEGKADDSTE